MIAAVKVSSHVSRLTKEKATPEFLQMVLETARRIEEDLRRT